MAIESRNIIKPSPVAKAQVYKIDPKAKLPECKTEEAAGYDVHCLESFSIRPGERVKVRTGLVIQPPRGFHTEIIPRSGLAAKHGIMLANNVGLVDRDYAGPEDEFCILLYMTPSFYYTVQGDGQLCLNLEDKIEPLSFEAGDRIAQLVFRQTAWMEFEEVDATPSENVRGGFGSTGVK